MKFLIKNLFVKYSPQNEKNVKQKKKIKKKNQVKIVRQEVTLTSTRSKLLNNEVVVIYIYKYRYTVEYVIINLI